MTPDELKKRTKQYALDVIRLARSLPADGVTSVVVRQLVKSATSVGANYRSSCRAKSRADFLSKMAIVEDEADETHYWLEILVDCGAVRRDAVSQLLDESDQLTRIFVASINTARGGVRR